MATEEREATKDEFTKMCRLNFLCMQQDAEAERQQQREDQRANQELMQMFGASLASMAAAWARDNTTASAVFRSGQQQPVVKALCEEQEEEALQEEEHPTDPKLEHQKVSWSTRK